MHVDQNADKANYQKGGNDMGEMIHDYYWGKNIPVETVQNPSEEAWKELVSKELQRESALTETLNQEQERLFREYIQTLLQRIEMDKEELFQFAFQAGANLQLEMLGVSPFSGK